MLGREASAPGSYVGSQKERFKVEGQMGSCLCLKRDCSWRCNEIMTLGSFLGGGGCFAPVPMDALAPCDYILTSYVLSFKAVSPGKTQALLLLPKSGGVCASLFGGFGFFPQHTEYVISWPQGYHLKWLYSDFEGALCKSQSQHPLGLDCWQF